MARLTIPLQADPSPLQPNDFDSAISRAAAFDAEELDSSAANPQLQMLQQSATGVNVDLMAAALTNARWLLSRLTDQKPSPPTGDADLQLQLESQVRIVPWLLLALLLCCRAQV